MLAPLALLLAGMMLAGCSTGDAVVFKTLAGEMPGERGTIPPHLASGPVGVPPPAFGRTRFRKDRKLERPDKRSAKRPATQKPATTSAAAAALVRRNDALRAQIFRQDDELQRIRRSATLHHTVYLKAVGGFGLIKERRLPDDNPAYRTNMRKARARLGRVNGDLLKLNALTARINATASQTSRLLATLRSVRARARDRVVRRELGALEPVVLETDTLPRKMLAEIQVDINQQSAYTRDQSRGLDMLAEAVAGDASRPSARVRQLEAESLEDALRPGAGAAGREGATAPARRSALPLVRIRFTRPDVDYKGALYRALQAALKQRPDLAFEVVGVAPSEAGQAGVLSRAQEVRFAMADMGVPPDRVTVTAETSGTAKSDEVRIFVR
ncbi:MAG TPA: hypothetical protein VM325_13630 [Alphaproteobacteria bacterium]|nr:hypothetical protein [Alphaproteobacteria bacterium]